MTDKIKSLLAALDLPEDMDAECVSLCKAMNLMLGIRTISSCCGHGKRSYDIWFMASEKDLPRLLYWFDGCHSGYYGWRIYVTTDCAMSPVHFCVEGPVGQVAYEQSKAIAALIAEAKEKK